MNRGPEVTLP